MFVPARDLQPGKRHLRLIRSDEKPSLLPRTRGECEGGSRPCPLVSCRHNLSLDSTFAGGIDVHWSPEDDPDRPSCALDVADAGGLNQGEVATILGVSKARVGQIEASALKKLKRPMSKDEW